MSLQFMFKTAADEDKALQADPTGISVSVENRGTDGQVRSEKTSVEAARDATVRAFFEESWLRLVPAL